ncbi:MAG: YwmB family TATA-box binding protein [Alkaliphilus sp.]
MRNKKAVLIIVMLALFGGMFYASAGARLEVEETEYKSRRHALLGVFEISKADFFEANIHTSLHLEDVFFEITEMESKKNEMIRELQLEGKIKTIEGKENFDLFMMRETLRGIGKEIFVNRISEDGYNQISVVAFDEDNRITVIILYSSRYKDEKESFIIIDKTQNLRYQDIEADKKTSEKLLSKYGDEIDTTICLVGSYDDKLTEIEKQKIFEKFLCELDAIVIDNVLSKMYTSATLYTPYIYESVEFNGVEVNLQVAIRYNEFENRTYIWIATPFITYTY